MSAAVAQPAPTPAKTSKGKKTAAKTKRPADHPKYAKMIQEALVALKERGGSSRQALLKYIVKHYNVGHDEKAINAHLKVALRTGVKNGSLKQAKGTGATGSFRVGAEKETKAAKKPKAARAKKPKAVKKSTGTPKKAVKPKKPATASSAAKTKKPKVAKKPKAAKATKPKSSPKKAKSAPKPKKAAAKPKKK